MSQDQQQPIGVIRVGGKQYAAGLFWQSAPTQLAAEREARRVAKEPQIGGDLFCIRKGEVFQFGLGRKSDNFKPGMGSAAGTAGDARKGTWLGVFRVDNGYFYCAVRKGAILPEGDAFYEDEDRARDQLRADLSLGGWEEVFAPVSWGISGAEEISFPDFVGKTKIVALRPLQASPASLLLPLLLLAGVGGVVYFLMFADEGEQAPITAVFTPPPPPPPPPPWIAEPDALQLAIDCEVVIAQLPTLPGYVFQQSSCSRGGVSAVYVRSFGNVSWLQEMNRQNKLASFSLNISSDTDVSLSTALPRELPPRGEGESPVSRNGFREFATAIAQNLRIDYSVTIDDAMVKAAIAENTPPPPFSPAVIENRGRFTPVQLLSAYGRTSTLVVDDFTFSNDGTWSFRGKVYVK